MLEKGDIENIEALVRKADYDHLPDSWLRIKMELEKLGALHKNQEDNFRKLNKIINKLPTVMEWFRKQWNQ
jgi:hypothetical protein